jgi:EF hand
MRIFASPLLVALLAALSWVALQEPPGGPEQASPPQSAEAVVARMMKFDKDKDDKLTRAEVTDQRLLRLFDRADTNKDGVVTKAELASLAAQFESNEQRGPRGFGPPGFGPPGRGPGFMMGPPRPGEILPPMLRRTLHLTGEQNKQIDELQKDVDARLAKILNDDQRKQLRELRERGPGRMGPPGRFGPPGAGPGPGRGFPPPGDEPPPPPDRL